MAKVKPERRNEIWESGFEDWGSGHEEKRLDIVEAFGWGLGLVEAALISRARRPALLKSTAVGSCLLYAVYCV